MRFLTINLYVLPDSFNPVNGCWSFTSSTSSEIYWKWAVPIFLKRNDNLPLTINFIATFWKIIFWRICIIELCYSCTTQGWWKLWRFCSLLLSEPIVNLRNKKVFLFMWYILFVVFNEKEEKKLCKRDSTRICSNRK